MPIKPENRARYPANWKTVVVPRIRARSGGKCERCGVPNGAIGYRAGGGFFLVAEAGRVADFHDWSGGEDKLIKIVLTVAHVHDPDPANCADDNLEDLCQRCHNVLDAPMRVQHARETRRSRKAIGDLFETAEVTA